MIWKNEKHHFQIMAMLGIVSTEFHLDPIQTLSPPGDVLSIIHWDSRNPWLERNTHNWRFLSLEFGMWL